MFNAEKVMKKTKPRKKIIMMLGDVEFYCGYKTHFNCKLLEEIYIKEIKYDHSKGIYVMKIGMKRIKMYPIVIIREDDSEDGKYNVWKGICVDIKNKTRYCLSLSEFLECESFSRLFIEMLEYCYDDAPFFSETVKVVYDMGSIRSTVNEFRKTIYETPKTYHMSERIKIEYQTSDVMHKYRD